MRKESLSLHHNNFITESDQEADICAQNDQISNHYELRVQSQPKLRILINLIDKSRYYRDIRFGLPILLDPKPPQDPFSFLFPEMILQSSQSPALEAVVGIEWHLGGQA